MIAREPFERAMIDRLVFATALLHECPHTGRGSHVGVGFASPREVVVPGHFTHIYTARRVADYLKSGEFPDWPQGEQAVFPFTPEFCGQAMKDFPKMTAIGAIGPDLFYFNQDYNSAPLGLLADEIMLALAIYYYVDAAKEQDWEPLLIILDGVNSTLAGLLRFLIKLQKAWEDFVDGWNKTVGPIVDDFENLLDGLTGGVLNQFIVLIDELVVALKNIAEEELLTFKDIFTLFNTCVQKGFDEKLFLWSDMSHYRRPAGLAQALMRQVQRLMAEDAKGESQGLDRGRQFLAFTLGYITHIGTDTVAHSFVNEQAGGPYRNHPQRHHLIENHIDAWNYQKSGADAPIPNDPWGAKPTYPEVTMSAMWFFVALAHDDQGDAAPPPPADPRPDPLPDDPKERKKTLDVDGEMPVWMSEAIVLAMIDAFGEGDHPRIMQGDAFQSAIDDNLMVKLFELLTGSGPDKPLPELLQGIAPAPSFKVPTGFPLPWEIGVMYRVMISFYKLIYNGNWELQKPRKPPFIITPPEKDIEDVLQPPDLKAPDPSHPEDICSDIVSLLQWAVKELEAAGKLAGDLIRMLNSPETYLIRLGLYEAAMLVWDTVTKTHEVMAHTGFFSPHGEERYDDGELRLPNEIDWPLITLGGTVDGAFQAALADNFDPFGNLDRDPNAIPASHSVSDPNYPYYPVLKYHTFDPAALPKNQAEGMEYRSPWNWPDTSFFETGGVETSMTTLTETYNPFASFGQGNDEAYRPLQPGPYPVGTMPDVFFRLDAPPVNPETRAAYEQAQTPLDTDLLNSRYLNGDVLKYSPLGDPIPFSAHLIGQLVNNTGYSTQFNLDSDRAFAYLTWDWVRNDPKAPNGQNTGILGLSYATPVEPPEGEHDDKNAAWCWQQGANPLLLRYVDPPSVWRPPPPRIASQKKVARTAKRSSRKKAARTARR